jgi:hypothetical protein
VFNSIREKLQNGELKIKEGRARKVMFGKDLMMVIENDQCLCCLRSYANSPVTRAGLQIGLWHVKGTVAYCSEGLNVN